MSPLGRVNADGLTIAAVGVAYWGESASNPTRQPSLERKTKSLTRRLTSVEASPKTRSCRLWLVSTRPRALCALEPTPLDECIVFPPGIHPICPVPENNGGRAEALLTRS
jgi:hypothetical protein